MFLLGDHSGNRIHICMDVIVWFKDSESTTFLNVENELDSFGFNIQDKAETVFETLRDHLSIAKVDTDEGIVYMVTKHVQTIEDNEKHGKTMITLKDRTEFLSDMTSQEIADIINNAENDFNNAHSYRYRMGF